MANGNRTQRRQKFLIIFTPGIGLMNRFKYASKFLLIGLLVLVPLSIFLYLQLSASAKEIALTEQKQVGLEYVSRLNDFLIAVDVHRALIVGSIHGDKDLKSQLAANEEALNQIVAGLNELDGRLGESLNSTEQWKALQSKWSELKGRGVSLTGQDALDQYGAILTDTRAIITRIANASHLVLDSQLDSYYLMDSTVRQFPTLMDRVGRARALAVHYAGAKTPIFTAEERTLTSLLDQIRTSMDNVKGNLESLRTENEMLSFELLDAWQEHNQLVLQLNRWINNQIIIPKQVDQTPKAVFDDLSNLVKQTQIHYDTELKAYEHLLQTKLTGLHQKNTLLVLLGLLITLALLYIFISFYLSVKRAVSALEQTATEVTNGNLTSRVQLQTRDELAIVGNSFNQMTEAFRNAIQTSITVSERVAVSAQSLTQSASQSTETSNRITDAIQEVAQGANTQLKGAEETSTAMEEMAQGVQRIAETSSSVSEAATQTSQLAQKGNDAVRKAVKQMENIHKHVDTSAKVIEELGARSQEIGSISSLITDVAIQTNLLALNASIEAARAGEHGAGFMVVASEVKKLAEQTKTAAAQISELIQHIQGQTKDASVHMNEGVLETKRGQEVIKQTGDAFEQIMSAVEHVAHQIQEVSAAAEQMSAGTQQVTASMGEIVSISRVSADNALQVSSSSQEQLATMQEIHASAEALHASAQELQQVIRRYTVV
ncbi:MULTISPECIES: methyl-accepting chemotaxis protein [Paenibacillus]|uniref:methyl-accepting chemotaxis protein n=1 Tax=Paenibacillus TaxID=44249 RepID=UPI001915EA6C|nr:HAMP domain-containing methyl-accepting chemotaxis protein [Paenibacillus sp. EPM92]